MKKKNNLWSIRQLQKNISLIEFPEYQREPTVWNLSKKKKLIDSILRNFDIAPIYLYKREDGYYDCIDGRQRINAITSFIGINIGNDEDDNGRVNNNFKFESSDELLGTNLLESYHGKRWADLSEKQTDTIYGYEINVIEISDIDKTSELNLMFYRLQLGDPLNAGEKLNAMVGDMRDYIYTGFEDLHSLGDHEYFKLLEIPQRRYAKELTAAQIAINYFSLQLDNGYKRARFVDIQDFVKEYQSFDSNDLQIAHNLVSRLDIAAKTISKKKIKIKNRAMGISTFFFINRLLDNKMDILLDNFIDFLKMFSTRLKVQVKKGFEIDPQYRELLNFQNYISQAAVERYAIENRELFLFKYFEYYIKNKCIMGDEIIQDNE